MNRARERRLKANGKWFKKTTKPKKPIKFKVVKKKEEKPKPKMKLKVVKKKEEPKPEKNEKMFK